MVFLLFPHCKRKVQKCVYTLWRSDTAIHPHENFAKRCFKCKASQAVFWPLPSYKELKLTTKPFTGCTLGGLLIPMQNISFQSSGYVQKAKFLQSLLIHFAFSPLLSFFCFFCLFFFFCWAFWWQEKFWGKL